MKNTDKYKIFAYGFDKVGFELGTEQVSFEKGKIAFIPFDSDANLDTADGALIPQGIFEQIKNESSEWSVYTRVSVQESMLLERERQVINLLRNQKWACFLVDEIIDRVPQSRGSQAINDTDLCKRVLNGVGVTNRENINGVTFLQSKRDEFNQYVSQYGVAKTKYTFYDSKKELYRTLVTFSGNVVGFEYCNQFFFLPFHTTKKSFSSLKEISYILAKAITDYRQKRMIEKPAWLDQFNFHSESELREKTGELLKAASKLENELKTWESYKTILTTSGENLKSEVIRILERFFNLKIDSVDDHREDAKILGENNDAIALVEIKGTKKGIRRENINQVDSHRERNDLPNSTPGILIINNEMSVEGISERIETIPSADNIKHAKNMNVTVIRTIDLLFLMRHFEHDRDAGNKFIHLISSGGGWLSCKDNSLEIIT